MYKFKPTLRHLLAGAAIVLGSAACSPKAALTVELKSDKGKILTATRPGSVDTGKWYGVKLTVAGDNVKAWLDDELIFDVALKPIR